MPVMFVVLFLDLSFGFLSRCSSSAISESKLRRLLLSDENRWLECDDDAVWTRSRDGLSVLEWAEDCVCARSIGLSMAAELASTSSLEGALSARE